MDENVRPDDMERITTPELAQAFIDEQVAAIREQVGDKKVLLALSGGVPLIASPINCGALCMIISLVIVPVVSLFTPAVPFQIKPPTTEGAIDREYDRELAQEELESATASAAADA